MRDNGYRATIYFMVFFIPLLIYAKERTLSDRELGVKWCQASGQLVDSARKGTTKRPPYHDGGFKPKLKLTIICKPKGLH